MSCQQLRYLWYQAGPRALRFVCIPFLLTAACTFGRGTSSFPAPSIRIVVPRSGESVPLEHPVIAFRLVGVAPPDSVDARTFRVWVDQVDLSAAFQVSVLPGGTEAWGSIDGAKQTPPSPSNTTHALTPGVHLVASELCTQRGVCATTHVAVTVLPTVAAPVAAAVPASANGPAVSAVPSLIVPPDAPQTLLALLFALLKKIWLH